MILIYLWSHQKIIKEQNDQSHKCKNFNFYKKIGSNKTAKVHHEQVMFSQEYNCKLALKYFSEQFDYNNLFLN